MSREDSPAPPPEVRTYTRTEGGVLCAGPWGECEVPDRLMRALLHSEQDRLAVRWALVRAVEGEVRGG